ncbi:MAG: ABC transporter permease [Saprospiraceae bacterium]
MFQNNLKIAWRNLLKNKSTSIINIIGLSTGLTCVILIFLWVQDEWGMDKFHAKDKQLYQVMEVSKANDKIDVGIHSQGLLAETLANDFPEVEASTAFFSLVNEGYNFNIKTPEQTIIKAGGVFADDKFFDMFSYPLVSGKESEVLKNKESMVISRSLATSVFGKSTDPIGKTINWEIMGITSASTVSGIFEDVPHNSSQKFDFVLTKLKLFEVIPNFKEWYNEGVNTFLQLKAGTNIIAFNTKIKDVLKSYAKDDRFTLFVRPYSDAYLYNAYENGKQAGGRIDYVKLFSIIGLFILLIACINFINLSTATSSTREKEIGIKKSIGSTKGELIYQFLTESVVLVLVSLVISIILVKLFISEFNYITAKSISFHLSPIALFTLFTGALLTGILAGYYPAFYLSGKETISILKGKLKTSVSEVLARKGLVVFQFVISLFLIVSVLVIYRQLQFIQTINLGYDKDNVVYIDRTGPIMEKSSAFINTVRKLPDIVNASSINGSIAQEGDNSTTSGISWPGEKQNQSIVFAVKTVDELLIETLGITMAEGRAYSDQYGTDKDNLIFNETAIKSMGLQDPIGKKVTMWGETKTIIGVTKDFFANSVHEKIPPIVMRYEPDKTTSFVIKIKKGKEQEMLAQLKSLYAEFNPGYPFKYSFLDEKYQILYAAEHRVAALAKYFAGLAILISCLGLFGLAFFNAKIRAKEIGIRKVLGATVSKVAYLLSKDFVKLALIAVCIAFPLSWWAMNKWLENYVYKTEVSTSTFIIAFLGIMTITIITVSFQAIKAAIANPIKSLRTE